MHGKKALDEPLDPRSTFSEDLVTKSSKCKVLLLTGNFSSLSKDQLSVPLQERFDKL